MVKYDAEATKKVLFDSENVNVTEKNPLKDLFQLCAGTFIILFCLYITVFAVVDIAIKLIPIEKQVFIENLMTFDGKNKIIAIPEAEQKKLYWVKDSILKVDKKFPKTSNLNIYILESEQYNAFCYPNGHIYITYPLYKELDTYEKLTFVIAHEMAHYRYKHHLQGVKRGISNTVIMGLLTIFNQNSTAIRSITDNGFKITELKFSRSAEKKADEYAAKMLKVMYGDTQAGVDVMNILQNKYSEGLEFVSTHPNYKRRIDNINKISK